MVVLEATHALALHDTVVNVPPDWHVASPLPLYPVLHVTVTAAVVVPVIEPVLA